MKQVIAKFLAQENYRQFGEYDQFPNNWTASVDDSTGENGISFEKMGEGPLPGRIVFRRRRAVRAPSETRAI